MISMHSGNSDLRKILALPILMNDKFLTKRVEFISSGEFSHVIVVKYIVASDDLLTCGAVWSPRAHSVQ